MAAAAMAIFIAEKRRPLRRMEHAGPSRTVRNLTMGATSMAVVALIQSPIVDPLARRVGDQAWGLARQPPWPEWAKDAAAFLLLDYTIYIWHVLTHKVPFLWRFHLVHNVDLDMDTTTAMRFHAVDMALSIPWRATQVIVCGASPRALMLWQSFFFTSVVFHHSNLRLPPDLERRLARLFTTPRLHGIHHSVVRDETNSNWSSGLSIWDWLHNTVRTDVPAEEVIVGVPAYRDPREITLVQSLKMPFHRQRNPWSFPAGGEV